MSDRERIERAFHAVKRPKWLPGLRSLDDAPVSVQAGPIALKPPAAWWRGLTSGMRHYHAAWHWLDPGVKDREIAEFSRLKAAAGLDHLHDKAIIPSLVDCMRKIGKQHSELRERVEERAALLEFLITEPIEQELLRQQRVRTRRALADALVTRDPMVCVRLCTETIRFALEGAAQTVCLIMGQPGRKYGFTANLMVPTALNANGIPQFTSLPRAIEVAERAAELWRPLALVPGSPCLTVVSDTERAGHIGFWVPLKRGEQDAVLPGAPAAYVHMIGSAVFKDRLPTLSGYPGVLTDSWRAYLKTHVREKLFISLPLVVNSEGQKPHTLAVLNVNADPPDGEVWRRACHDPWLLLSQQWVADFIETAYLAHMHRTDVARSESGVDILPPLASGLPLWNTFRREEDTRALPEHKGE